MLTVSEYPVVAGKNGIMLPPQSVILSAFVRDQHIHLAVLRVDREDTKERRIYVASTDEWIEGAEFAKARFVGTVQVSNLYAFHVFDLGESTS